MKKMNEIQVFCENIKGLRKKNNLSKREMAKICGITVQSLSMLEQGILPHRTSTGVIFKICCYFGLKPHELFTPL